MCNNFDSVISAGSNFVSQTSSALLNLSGATSVSPISNQSLMQLEEKSKNILVENGWLDVPLLIERLSIDADTSIKIMKSLKNKGIIMKQDAI